MEWSLTEAEWLLLKQVAAVLRPFYEVTNELQADKQVSISRVLPCMLQLIDSLRAEKDVVLEPDRYSSEGRLLEAASRVRAADVLQPVKTLRKSLLQSLDDRWRTGIMMEPHIELFQLAAALDPRNRGHTLIKKEGMWAALQALVKSVCLARADELADHILRDETMRTTAIWDQLSSSVVGGKSDDDSGYEEEGAGGDDDGDAEVVARPAQARPQSVRVRGWSASYYSQAPSVSSLSGSQSKAEETARDVVKRSLDAELAKYFSNHYPPLPLNYDPIAYWRTSCAEYPVLGKLAIITLTIPASSAGVERLFSMSGLTVTKLRTRLAPERVNKMLLLQRNWDDRLYVLSDDELKQIAGRKDSRKRKRMDDMLDQYVDDTDNVVAATDVDEDG
jgi:hypothetical protein